MKIFACLVLALCLASSSADEVRSKARAMVAVKIQENLEQMPDGFVAPLSTARFAEQLPIGAAGVFLSGMGASDDPSEYDTKIQQTQAQLKSLDGELQEAQQCAHRVSELRAQKRDLQENLDNWQKEKEKAILETKLTQQMTDLNQVASMTQSLRSKYNELKRTQDLIRARLTGTRTSLTQLDDGDQDPDVVLDNGEQIAAEMDAMHKAQAQILSASHYKNVEAVKNNIKQANEAHDQALQDNTNDAGQLPLAQ